VASRTVRMSAEKATKIVIRRLRARHPLMAQL
jgi:hypothetical protein